MKTKNILKSLIAIVLLALTACSSDDAAPVATTANELDGLIKIKEISNDAHLIELYSKTSLQQGYNAVWLRIKNTATGKYESDAAISVLPLMHMAMMTHSCPASAISKVNGSDTLYRGYIVFQMAQNDAEYWDLTIDYTIGDGTFTATAPIDVPASETQRVASFTGADGGKYIIALIDPENPRVALNDMTAAVYRMNSMTSFSEVDHYSIKIDPRMPGMGNHGSPNNTDLTQSGGDHLYHGKLSLTMTGYWRINLQLFDDAGNLLKGEAIEGDVTQSSLYFETEF